MSEKAYIDPPKRLPLLVRFGTWIAERKTKKEMLVPKLLAWYPRAALSSGLFESLITHKDKQIPHRLLQLIRIQVSLCTGCSFCIAMNREGSSKNNIIEQELAALNGGDLDSATTFSPREIAALHYTRLLTATPVTVAKADMEELQKYFSEREIIIICTTIGQVNYWSRLNKGLGVPVACPIEKL